MKNFLKKITDSICLTSLIFFFSWSTVKAETFNEIIVSGNKRLSVDTVLMFSGIDIKKNLDANDLNLAIKRLYKTDYFKKIEILIVGDKLEIKILENPIIQTIKINGIKNKSIIKDLSEITKKSEKYPFLISNIKEQENLILNIFMRVIFLQLLNRDLLRHLIFQ